MITTTDMPTQPVLIANHWRSANSSGSFRAENPATREPLDEFPISTWADCDEALQAASVAFHNRWVNDWPADKRHDASQFADFLDAYAARIEANKAAIVEMANRESGLPVSPRLADNELPRTTSQLRQAAAAAREGAWALPTIDKPNNIRSMFGPIGPVIVFGPNNFPLAFNSIAGGDFAAAIASGNPVIAKANTSHPGTTLLLAKEAHAAAEQVGLPAGWIQLLFRTSHEDGEKLVSDPRVGATGYTGSRHAGLKLKAAADKAGKPIYLELSSVNPVVILPGALEERLDDIAGQFSTSCLMGAGQFCTNPGLVLLIAGDTTEKFLETVVAKFKAAPVGTLLSANVAKSLQQGIGFLIRAGAHTLVGGKASTGSGYCHANTLLRASGQQFLDAPEALQTEAFGNASLVIVAEDLDEVARCLEHLEGNLTGCIYSHTTGADDAAYNRLAPQLRLKVGRLINDKMPTGVAVSPAMNHGGPYPSTSHPGFTAVGIPASLRRFAALHCYDNVRPNRLPPQLRDE
ncbi:MAG TPA: aldehyde dehydrogenase (NADP(+)) [Pirellulaceae bacterium]|jgi:NADP-dependent aldehyde dehydrogenase